MKKLAVIFLVVIATGSTLLFSITSSEKHKTNGSSPSCFLPGNSLFHSGDIIFRDGRGAISSLFRNCSLNDPCYSHAGIIHEERGQFYVFHVIGGEGNEGIMRKDKIVDFCRSEQAYSFAVYRTDQDNYKIDSLAKKYYDNHLRFDPQFDLNSDDKMYCTELIFKILQQVTGENNFLPLTTFAGVSYCACDNIYLSPHLKKIYTHIYTH